MPNRSVPAVSGTRPSSHAEPRPEPVDVATIRATAERALTVGPSPRYEQLEELEHLLHGHLKLLLPIAEAAVNALDRGTVEWYGQRTVLDTARGHMDEGMGEGLVSARVHVRQLGHDTRALLRYADGTGQ